MTLGRELAVVVLLSSAGACKPKEGTAPESWPVIAGGMAAPALASPILELSRLGLRGVDGGPDPAGVALLGAEQLTVTGSATSLLNDLAPALHRIRHVRGSDRSLCVAARDQHRQPRCVRIRLLIEDDFHAWLDGTESRSKIRVVMRSDGMEVAGARGKVPGPDRFGPSILPVNGQPDFSRLDAVSAQLKRQLPEETEAGILASAATPFDLVVKAAACLNGPDAKRFPSTFIVVP